MSVCLSIIKGGGLQLRPVHIELSACETYKMHSILLSFIAVLGFIALASGQEQLLMFSGGTTPYARSSKNVTLISLDGGPQVPECLQNLNPHPRLLISSCSATLGDGKWKI